MVVVVVKLVVIVFIMGEVFFISRGGWIRK